MLTVLRYILHDNNASVSHIVSNHWQNLKDLVFVVLDQNTITFAEDSFEMVKLDHEIYHEFHEISLLILNDIYSNSYGI